MIFVVYYVAALALVGAELRGLLPTHLIATPRRIGGTFWIATLLAVYGAQVAVAHAYAKAGAWPIPVLAWNSDSAAAVGAMLLFGAIESYALVALYRRGAAPVAVFAAAAIMAAFSIVAPVLNNQDLYAYVGNGILEHQAYAPPSASFSGDLTAINLWWGHPMPPTGYGPLWLAIAHVVTAPWPTLFAKLLALRFFGLAMLVTVIILLRALGTPARVLAIVAVNPGLYSQFVLDGHNDLLPTAIVLMAALVARARPALAAALIATAALSKLPFALLGLPALGRIRSRPHRLAACAFAIAASVLASWFAGGAPYFRALRNQVGGSPSLNAFHAIAALAAAAAIAAATFGPRRLRSVVWLLPAVAPYPAPWYAIWSLSYSLGARRALVYLIASFPFVCALFQPSLVRWWTLLIVLPLATMLSLRPPRRSA